MPPFAPWAFLGLFAGVWKLLVVAGAVALFLWQKGLLRHPIWRLVRLRRDFRPAEDRTRAAVTPEREASAAGRGFWARVAGDRWYLLLAITMALTLLAWILARITIHGSAG